MQPINPMTALIQQMQSALKNNVAQVRELETTLIFIKANHDHLLSVLNKAEAEVLFLKVVEPEPVHTYSPETIVKKRNGISSRPPVTNGLIDTIFHYHRKGKEGGRSNPWIAETTGISTQDVSKVLRGHISKIAD